MLPGPTTGPKPFSIHTHCNVRFHFNHDRLVKNTYDFSSFFLVTHTTLLMHEQAMIFIFILFFHLSLMILWEYDKNDIQKRRKRKICIEKV